LIIRVPRDRLHRARERVVAQGQAEGLFLDFAELHLYEAQAFRRGAPPG